MSSSRTGTISFFSWTAAANSLARSADLAAFEENNSPKIWLAWSALAVVIRQILARADQGVIPRVNALGPELDVQQLRPGFVSAPIADEDFPCHKAPQPYFGGIEPDGNFTGNMGASRAEYRVISMF
jgi:hypothetical protein